MMTSELTTSHHLTSPSATVSVGQPDSHPNAILMTWQHDVETGDVSDAFEHINTILDASDIPMVVIVDIRDKPKFPMSETIFSALRGLYRHDKLTAWLVVGENRLARMIESVLSTVTRRSNVEWFESIKDVLDYLGQRSEESA